MTCTHHPTPPALPLGVFRLHFKTADVFWFPMDTQFKVESGIPFKGSHQMPLKRIPLEKMYPFKQMAVGDSFFVPGYTIKPSTVQVGISRVNRRGVIEGWFKSQPVVENDVAGCRVWRVQ